MTITLIGPPVSSGYMGDDTADILSRRDVAALLGVDPDTITNYLTASGEGGIYEKHPFPAPRRVGGRPYWLPEEADAIREWDRTKPRGRGGRPRRSE